MPFGKALEFAKAHQPNPLERSRPLRDLRAKVTGLCTDKTEPVKFITAVGTPLDTHHGADGLFEQNGRIATVDISLREKEIHKASVLIVAILSEEGDVNIGDDELEQAAQKIAARLNERQQRHVAQTFLGSFLQKLIRVGLHFSVSSPASSENAF